jgi:hypothetical protein
MRRIFLSLIVSFAFLFAAASSNAQSSNIVVPAGTLLHCTLDEPNFSSATADIGDPVVCHLSSLREFGQNVFPRGSYLGGHLEADKDPGHFWGKGYLKIEFDRIGFPTSDVPVPSKVIAAKSYRVDKKGDIVGKGHPKRDVVEWLIPPLWPWKVLTLPARGPRPALKGESQITVRLMDDIEVPRNGGAYHSYDQPANRPPALYRRQDFSHPASERSSPEKQFDGTISGASYVAGNTAPQAAPTQEAAATANASAESNATAGAGSAASQSADASGVSASAETPAAAHTQAAAQAQSEVQTQTVAMQTPVAAAAPSQSAAVTDSTPATRLKMIALKSENVYAVTKYRINGGSLSYVLPSGATGSVDITEVDWRVTSRLNGEPVTAGAEKSEARPTALNLQ